MGAFQGVELVEEVRAGQMSMKQCKVLAKITKNSSMEIKRLALAAHAAEKQMKKFRLIAEKAPIESQKTTQMILSSVPWLPLFSNSNNNNSNTNCYTNNSLDIDEYIIYWHCCIHQSTTLLPIHTCTSFTRKWINASLARIDTNRRSIVQKRCI